MAERKKIEIIIDEYSAGHQEPLNRSVQWLCVPLLTFGFLGIIWSIPFPYLSFLGKYNGFVNWASFLIAFVIYYYYRLSPLLSYSLLLVIFVFSAGIVGLEKLELATGLPHLWMSVLIFLTGLIMMLIGYTKERKTSFLVSIGQTLLHGPLWLVSKLFRKSG